jgi:hypothetical protein
MPILQRGHIKMSISGRVGLTQNYPSIIPGTVMQLDAATLTSSPVSSWSYAANPNGGPNDFTTVPTGNFVQATGAKQPIWTPSSINVNGQPSVVYDGTKVLSYTPTASDPISLLAASDMTMATIMYLSSFPIQPTVVSKGTSTGGFDFYFQGSNSLNPGRGIIATIPASAPYPTPFVAGKLFSLIVTISATTATTYVNGAYEFSGLTSGMTTTPNTNPVFIGQRTDAGTKLFGEQPELLLINRCLAPSEIATLHAFWATKYNLPV